MSTALNPCADLDSEDEDDVISSESLLQDLVTQVDPTISVQEYVSADDDLTTCFTFENPDEWREELRSMVCDESSSAPRSNATEDEDEDVEPEDLEPEESSTIKSYGEAIKVSNDLLCFLSEHIEWRIRQDICLRLLVTYKVLH